MVVSLKVFKVFVDETTENCYANYKVNRNFIYLITKSRRKLVRNMAKAVRMADIAQRLGISTVSVSKGLAGKEGVSAEMRAKIVATAEEMGYQPPARTNAHPGGESIGFVGSVLSTSSIMDRYLGYVKAMLRAGLPIRDDWRLEDRDDQGKFVPFSLPHEMPDAFVCNCDAVAYNLVEILKRNGYRVPQDVAVTGYDDYRYSTLCSPQLTSYRVDLDGMAKTVVAQLRRKMAHKPAIAPTVIVPGGFVRREST